MDIQKAIEHARDVAKKKYVEGMLCHANPNDEELDGCIKCAREHEQLADWLGELQKYKQLGTLEEVREAMEKQKAKKPNNVNTEGYRYTDTYRCPTCGGNFSGTGIVDYCYHCGQKLDWSEVEE